MGSGCRDRAIDFVTHRLIVLCSLFELETNISLVNFVVAHVVCRSDDCRFALVGVTSPWCVAI